MKITSKYPDVKVSVFAIDIQNHTNVDDTVRTVVSELGDIEILVNNVSSYFLIGSVIWLS